jgi:hypothetical protein
MEYLPDLESALHNITTAYYRDYAFLGSWSLLDYIIRINYTQRSVHVKINEHRELFGTPISGRLRYKSWSEGKLSLEFILFFQSLSNLGIGIRSENSYCYSDKDQSSFCLLSKTLKTHTQASENKVFRKTFGCQVTNDD